MGKIKVCFVCPYVYTLFNPKSKGRYGGAEVQVYLISKELSKDNNFDVSLIVADLKQKDLKQKRVEKYGNINIYKSFPFKKKAINYLRTPFILYGTLKKINPDLIIQRSAAPETGICAFFANINNKKFIYSVSHDMDVNGRYSSNGIYGRIYEYGIGHSDFVVLQHNHQAELLRRWKKRKPKRIKTIKTSYYINSSTINNKKTILWVGRAVGFKRPSLFLKLAERFPRQHFLMIMPKSSDIMLWKKIQSKAENIRNLKFIEKVHFKDIDKYFKQAKVFVNTSKDEGFPNTFVQAAKNKTPILSLNVDPDNFIRKHRCGFYCENSFEKLKNRLETILTDKKLYNLHSKNAFFYAKSVHDIKKLVIQWKRLIKYLVETDLNGKN